MNQPTLKEMTLYFNKRTDKHINLVQYFANKLVNEIGFYIDLLAQVKFHDQSKYKEPEHTPYLYLTWRYKSQREGLSYQIPEKTKIDQATWHHIKNNRHHPEFHDDKCTIEKNLNSQNRDEVPLEIVDASQMPDIDIAEMVCDWCAMSFELNGNPFDWSFKNVNQRWKFSNYQVNLINRFLHTLWPSKND